MRVDSEEDFSFYPDAEDVSSLENVTGGGEEESCKLCDVVIKSSEEDNMVGDDVFMKSNNPTLSAWKTEFYKVVDKKMEKICSRKIIQILS